MTTTFNRLNDALNAVVEQGAKRISTLNPYGSPSFSFERTALTVDKAPATCSLFRNPKGKWELDQWYIGTGGHIDLQPAPVMALGHAIAEYYFSDKPRIENIPLPRTLEADDLQQFHYNSETGCYQSADGGGFTVDEVLGFFLLSPEEQESSLLPNFRVKSWLGDCAPVDWSEYLYSPNDYDLYLYLYTADDAASYSALITYDGEVQIETGFGKTIWADGDRLTPEEVNERFPKIYAQSLAYGAAMELGIKVTHRESSPDCGTYTDIRDW
jgi:hypothetical protein